MSESIKASEVSDVLRMQLEGIDTKLRFDEVGTVLQVSDGVVRIYGLQNAEPIYRSFDGTVYGWLRESPARSAGYAAADSVCPDFPRTDYS